MPVKVGRKARLLARARRIRGQIDAVERALETEIGCADLVHLIASARGAMNGLTVELLAEHIRLHAADTTRYQGADELIDVVHAYLK